MGELSPLLFVIIIYLCFIYPLAKAKKKGAGNSRKGPPSQTPATGAAPQEIPEAETFTAEGTGPQPERISRLREPFADDEDLYRGSLNAVTGEGTDPCHEEQMQSLQPAPESILRGEPEGGLKLSWTGNEIVRGFVMSEVLKKKH